MVFFDWNRDGKKDMQDAFLEYNIFKACTEDTAEYGESDEYDVFSADFNEE